MEFKFSVFFILMLVQTVLSVPVDKNRETKDVMATSDYLELFKTPIKINEKLKNLLDELSHLKLNESSLRRLELFDIIVKEEVANAKSETDDILSQINSNETKKKLQDVYDEFSNLKIVESSKKLTEKMANLVKQNLVNVKAKADDISNPTNFAETKKKLQDILDELSNINLTKIYKKFEEQASIFVDQEVSEAWTKFDEVLKDINSTETKIKSLFLLTKYSKIKFFEIRKNFNKLLINIFEKELSGLKDKVDAILNQINPSEVKKKFQDLFEELSTVEISKFYKKFEEELKNTFQQELPGVRAKVDDILKQINSAETKKKLQDFFYELSILNWAELTKKFEKRMYNFVDEELPGVKTKIDDILNQINSAKTKQKMQDLLNLLANFKLVEASKNMAERLADLLQQEFTADGKTE